MKNINKLKEFENELFISLIDMRWEKERKIASDYSSGLSFKNNYSSQLNMTLVKTRLKDYQDGFIANQADFFLYSIPSTIIIFLLLKIAYKITKKYPLKFMFQKFDLFGTFVIMLTEGNIEQFTFYLIGQMLSLFHFNYRNKMINCLMIWLLFIVIFAATCSFVVLMHKYRKKLS